jgi:hypothetical protein
MTYVIPSKGKNISDDSFDLYINEKDNVDLDKIIQWPGKWKCHTIGLRIEELKVFISPPLNKSQ